MPTFAELADDVVRKISRTAYRVAVCIIPDLLCFTWKEAIGLAIFAAASIIFSFISFNHLYDPVVYPSIYNTENDKLAGVEKWRRNLMCISGAASFTGVLSVVLTTKGKVSCFFWGAINSLLYGLFAYAYGYAGDAQLNLFFFLPVQFIGMYLWSENLKESDDTVKSEKLSIQAWIISIVVTGAISVAFFYEIPVFAVRISGIYYFDGMDIPRSLDAICNAVSMVAQVLSLLRYSEQWYWWILVDALQIAMYTGIAGYGIVINVVVMWCLFMLNALAGLYAWHIRGGDDYMLAKDGDSVLDDLSDIQLVIENEDGTRLSETLQTSPSAEGNDQVPFATPLTTRATSNSQVSEQPPQSLSGASPLRGLCVGKFWPFHLGHQYLFSEAQKQCDELYIIICDKPGYHQPSGKVRMEWIRECNPRAHVKVIKDVYDPNDSKLWADLCKAWCGFVPDIVFTSETYGNAWAQYLGCKHALVDLKRSNFPVSGTMVRSSPITQWQYLPAPARGYYAQRIVVVGSESTGKTTLCQSLAKHFRTKWVKEYGRILCEKKMAEQTKKEGFPSYEWTDDDFRDIIVKQSMMENRAGRKCSDGVIFCDTNAFATLIWYERYMNKAPPADMVELQKRTMVKPTLYLFLKVKGSKFVQDGYRDGENIRDSMERQFQEKLAAQNVPVEVIDGPFEERFTKALDILYRYL